VSLLAEREVGVPTGEVAASRRRRSYWALVPWALAATGWTLALLKFGTPGGDIALYAAYLGVAIVLPGTLVHRAFRGSRGNLPEDLGLGAATGLFVLIAGWALAAATDQQTWLPAWPLLIIALFVAVPGLRRHWRIPAAERRPLPVTWSWIMAAVALALVAVTWTFWRDNPLPPATTYYYQDLMYHLALVHEMTRSMPFQVPQLAGETLRYHYLADADMAAATMITRIPAEVLLFRLWIIPIGVIAVVVCAAITREVAGKWWAGALGGAASLLAWPLTLGSAVGAFGGSPFSFSSPSQSYSIPLLALLIAVSLDVLRGRRMGWTWVLVLPLAVACAGAKESTLPLYVAGMALVVLVMLVRHRDRLRGGLLLLGMALLAMAIGVKIFAGGGAGTLKAQAFAILGWAGPWRAAVDPGGHLGYGDDLLPYGISHGPPAALQFAFGLLGWWILMQAARLFGVAGLLRRRVRADPTAWLLSGIVAAGTGGLWLFWHPASSQIYFFFGAAPFGALLTVWLLADQARSWRPVVTGLAAGALWAIFAPDGVRPRRVDRISDWVWALFEPLLLAAAVAAGVALVMLLIWGVAARRFAWRAVPAGLTAAILGAALAAAVDGRIEANFRPNPTPPLPIMEVSAGEMRAALWLGRHSGRDDVIATNVHCQPVTSWNDCDSRAFWVVGLSGRRAVVESWGYSDEAVSADGRNGLRYMLQPPPDPDLYALNQRVFHFGDGVDIERLHRVYHVRWLFDDARVRGGLSPDLDRICRLRYRSGPVSIYEL
jgi:hypothetical protein